MRLQENIQSRLYSKVLLGGQSEESVFRRALFERPESLSQFLPYEEFLQDSNTFCMKDGSLGAVFEAELLQHETLTSEEVIAAVGHLKAWFSLPENCSLQILWDQSILSPNDAVFEGLEETNEEANCSSPVSRELFRSRLEAFREKRKSTRTSSVLKRRALVSLRVFPQISQTHRGRSLLAKGEYILYRELQDFIGEYQAFLHLITDFQRASRLRLKLLGARELVDYLRQFFNPKTYYERTFAPVHPRHSISNQVLFNNPFLSYAGIEREGVKTRTLTLKTSPQFVYPGGMAYFLKLPFPIKISLGVSFPSKTQVKTFFDLKEFFLQNTPSARAKRQQQEILETQDKLAREDRCLLLTFNVLIEGENDEELDARVREVVGIFNHELGCEAIVEREIGLGLCLNTLPLFRMLKADYSSQRAIRILRSDIVHLIPLFDSYRGLTQPHQLYLSREGNLVKFSLTENETSNHTVVLADSGSGKSAFIIDCIQAVKRLKPEPLVFVIDKKSSYKMLSQYFDGDLTLFDRREKMPFSPFRGIYDEEKIAFLSHLIVSAVKLTSPSFELESHHLGAISKALRLAYEKKAQQMGLRYQEGRLIKTDAMGEVCLAMDDFVAELAALPSESQFESMALQMEELLLKLSPFYGDGIYAPYFHAHESSVEETAKSFYIYDLDRLDSDPILQALMTMAVVEEIRRVIRLPQNAKRGGFIVIEELGMLGRENSTASRFILDAAETFRKLGFWLIGLTPRPQNFFELEAGKAMWSVADNFVFLQMSPDNVDYLAKHSAMLDEASREIIKSLRTIKGQSADVFYMDKKKCRQGAFQYVQTPLDRWLAPTNAQDAQRAETVLHQFKTNSRPGEDYKWKALEFLSTQS